MYTHSKYHKNITKGIGLYEQHKYASMNKITWTSLIPMSHPLPSYPLDEWKQIEDPMDLTKVPSLDDPPVGGKETKHYYCYSI